MMVGDPQVLAIESEISDVVGHAGIGYFVVYVSGRYHGVREPDATMLANSVNEVAARVARRGTHRLEEAELMSASEVAERYLRGAYLPDPTEADERFADALRHAHIIWAPDGDEAFDDGSHILQFDHNGTVRIVALRNEEDLPLALTGAVDVTMPEGEFYDLLGEWQRRFLIELQQRRRPN